MTITASDRQNRTILNKIKSLCIVFVSLAVIASPVAYIGQAIADIDGYPWNPGAQPTGASDMFGYQTCPSNDTGCMHQTSNGYGISDPWLYWLRQCTSYAAWKVKQVFGIDVPNNLGDASTWYSKAQQDGFGTVYSASNYTPQIGDIADWVSKDHVAYVYNVNNGIASLDEYNVGLDGNFYTTRTTASNSAGTPDYYIHVGTPSGGVNTSWPGVGNATFLGGDRLSVGQTMYGNQYIVSGNVKYALLMQGDGNLVLYSGQSALWASNTSGNPGAYLTAQSDGNVVIYSSNHTALWATNTTGQNLSYLQVQDDGNIVAYNTSILSIWSSGTGGNPPLTYVGSDRLYDGAILNGSQYFRSSDGRYAALMQGDGNYLVYGPGYHVLWSTGKGGNPGSYLNLQTDSNIVEYSSNGTALWATNTVGKGLNFLLMQSDGNLVAYPTSGPAFWATNTGGQI